MGISSRALSAGKAIISLSLDGDSKVQAGLKKLQAKVGNIGSMLSRTALIGASAFAGLSAPLGAAIKLASDASESLNKFNAVFGNEATAAGKWADETAAALGRSKTEIKDALSAFQGFFVGLGVGAGEASKLSQKIEAAAIDFASFHNLTDAEAMERFISALSGSSEVLDRFGINTKQAALQQELLRMGVNKSWTEVTELEKTTARMNVILAAMGSQGALGDAQKTAGSFANRMKALRARINDTAIEIGQTLLPAATEWLGKIQEIASSVAKWVSENHQLVLELAATVVKVGLASAAMFALGKAISAVSIAVGVLRGAITLLTRHPLVAVITLVGAAAIAFANWMGWLDRIRAWFVEMATLIPGTTGEIQNMTGALNDAAAANRDLLKSQIAANRATTGNPWGITADRKPPMAADNGMFADFAKDEANKQLLAKAREAWEAVKNYAAGVDNDLTNAFGNALLGPQKAARFRLAVNSGMQTAQSAANQTGVFDTRLARQMFGAGSNEEIAELRKHTKLLGSLNKKRGGLPVI